MQLFAIQPNWHEFATKTKLAKPYHFRREGRYYLRIRKEGSKTSFSVSLRSTDKSAAMSSSNELQGILRAFQLDNPYATWDEITECLKAEADLLFARRVQPQYIAGYFDLLEDHVQVLTDFAATEALTVKQAATIKAAIEIFKATQRKLQGDPEYLAKIVGSFARKDEANWASDVPQLLPLSPSVRAVTEPTKARPAKTFKELAETYMDEHKDNIKLNTLKSYTTAISVLTEAFEACGVVNIVDHSRADLVKVKQWLANGRAPITVNKYLTNLSSILTWAVDNDLMTNNYSQRLKITKGTESDRRGFTPEQIDRVLAVAKEEHPWMYWACSLAAVTGARQQEILQLTKADILITATGASIDINERGETKSVKNKGSRRQVPLVECKWFNLEDFALYLSTIPEGGEVFAAKKFSKHRANIQSTKLMTVVRAAVGEDKALVFHSFRHAISGLLQAAEVSVQVAAAILGHKTGTITFDVYGSTMGQDTLRSALHKVLPPSIAEGQA